MHSTQGLISITMDVSLVGVAVHEQEVDGSWQSLILFCQHDKIFNNTFVQDLLGLYLAITHLCLLLEVCRFRTIHSDLSEPCPVGMLCLSPTQHSLYCEHHSRTSSSK